jgi:serine/threonine protein kinase
VKTVCTLFSRTGLHHKDLKTENLVILDTNSEGALVGIIDYGFAIKNNPSSSDKRTTEFYAPPEAFKAGNIDTEKFDVFCLGSLLLTIIFRDSPFHNKRYARDTCENDPWYQYYIANKHLHSGNPLDFFFS